MRHAGQVVYFPCPWHTDPIVGHASVVSEGPLWTALAKNVHRRSGVRGGGSGSDLFFLPTDRLCDSREAAVAESWRMCKEGESVSPGSDTNLLQRVVGRRHPWYQWKEVSEGLTGARHE